MPRVEVAGLPPALAERLSNAELTYAEVGRTDGELPPGYHHLRRVRVVGTGQRAFDAAADAVLHWQVQVRAGLRPRASSPAVVPGAVACMSLGAGPLGLDAPCRVVYVIDQARRKGFGYGTLPGHPESGEEAFIVQHEPDDRVTLNVIAFSRPATMLAKVGAPVARLAQELVTRRYLRALATG